MDKIILTLFLIVNTQLAKTQIHNGQLCLSTTVSSPTYHCVSTDTSRMNHSLSAKPLRIPSQLSLLDSNSFFVRINSTLFDSIHGAKLSDHNEITSLKKSPFNEKSTEYQYWKLISIQDYGNYIPCCLPPYQVNNIYFLEPANFIFPSDKLVKSFKTDNTQWVFSNYGDRYLTITYSFSYVMNDSATGGTIYTFKRSNGI